MRKSLLFLVYECVREVCVCVWVGDTTVHFAFIHHHLLYVRGSCSFHADQIVSVWAFPSFNGKKKYMLSVQTSGFFLPPEFPLVHTVCYR